MKKKDGIKKALRERTNENSTFAHCDILVWSKNTHGKNCLSTISCLDFYFWWWWWLIGWESKKNEPEREKTTAHEFIDNICGRSCLSKDILSTSSVYIYKARRFFLFLPLDWFLSSTNTRSGMTSRRFFFTESSAPPCLEKLVVRTSLKTDLISFDDFDK